MEWVVDLVWAHRRLGRADVADFDWWRVCDMRGKMGGVWVGCPNFLPTRVGVPPPLMSIFTALSISVADLLIGGGLHFNR